MRTALVGLVSALALASCAQQQASELQGRWEVQEIAGAPLGEGVHAWIEFDQTGEAVYGFTGCKNFTTTAAVFESTVSLALPAEQPGACPSQAAATDEARFLGVLPGVQRFIRHGNSLELLQAARGSESLLRLRRVEAGGGD